MSQRHNPGVGTLLVTCVLLLLSSVAAVPIVQQQKDKLRKVSPLAISQWSGLGPFAVGKTEYDADPVEARGGPLHLFAKYGKGGRGKKQKEKGGGKKRGKSLKIPSELSSNGYVSGWTSFTPSTAGGATQVQWPSADMNAVIQTMSSVEAATFQSWIVGFFTTPKVGSGSDSTDILVLLACEGVHSFFVAPVVDVNPEEEFELAFNATATAAQRRLFAGDVYALPQQVEDSRHLGPNFARLERGKRHVLYFKLRGRSQNVFSCTAGAHSGNGKAQLVPFRVDDVFDFWQGRPALGSTMIGLSAVYMPATEEKSTVPSSSETMNLLSLDQRREGGVSVEAKAFVTAASSSWLARFPQETDRETLKQLGLKGDVRRIPVTIRQENPFLISPGQSARIGVDLDLGWSDSASPPLEPESSLDRDQERCLTIRVAFFTTTTTPLHQQDDNAAPVIRTIDASINCRKRLQSFMWTYLDHDGSPNHAASIAPIKEGESGHKEKYPVLVSLSGVGVGPRQAADSHKFKPPKAPDTEDYTFGLDRAWILAPSREGAHNWEGQGMLACLTAIDQLAERSRSSKLILAPANPHALLVNGHSRGGHGAWSLASRIPDRVLALHVGSGWYNRQTYGDSNKLFLHDLQLMHMDSSLKGVLEATILENDNGLHTSNLCTIPNILIRSGTNDRSVPPWNSRRMARHLEEVCHRDLSTGGQQPKITYTELAGKEHWWWDTKKGNDGGAMFDVEVRSFLKQALDRYWERNHGARLLTEGEGIKRWDSLPTSFRVSAYAPHLFTGVCGFRILEQTQRFIHSHLDVSVVVAGGERGVCESDANVADCTGTEANGGTVLRLGVKTRNVKRFTIPSKWFIEMNLLPLDFADAKFSVEVQVNEIDSATPLRDGDENTVDSMLVVTNEGLVQSLTLDDLPDAAKMQLGGSTRQFFDSPWRVQTRSEQTQGDAPDASPLLRLQDLATYITNHHAAAQATTAGAHAKGESNERQLSLELRHVGANFTFSSSGDRESPPCSFSLDSHAVVFLDPQPAKKDGDNEGSSSSPSTTLRVMSSNQELLTDLVHYTFTSDQALSRAAFTNMYPDVLVVNQRFSAEGYGGVVAAGWLSPSRSQHKSGKDKPLLEMRGYLPECREMSV